MMMKIAVLTIVLCLFFVAIPQAQVVIIEGDVRATELAGDQKQIVYADTSGQLYIASQGDTLILRDSLGNVRFILDANAGTLQALNNDTVWYQLEIGSPPKTLEVLEGGYIKQTGVENGFLVERISRINAMGDTVCVYMVRRVVSPGHEPKVLDESFCDSAGHVRLMRNVFRDENGVISESFIQFAENSDLITTTFERPDSMVTTIYEGPGITIERLLKDGVSEETVWDTLKLSGLKRRADPHEPSMTHESISPDQPYSSLPTDWKDKYVNNNPGGGKDTITRAVNPSKKEIRYLFSDSLSHKWINDSGDTICVTFTPGEYKQKTTTSGDSLQTFLEVFDNVDSTSVGFLLKRDNIRLLWGTTVGAGSRLEVAVKPSEPEIRFLFSDSVSHVWQNGNGDTIRAVITPVDQKVKLLGNAEVNGGLDVRGDIDLICPTNPLSSANWSWAGDRLLFVVGSGTATDAILFNPAEDSIVMNTGKLRINGDLAVSGTKFFVIDHPDDPDKALYHACMEGPERLNVYSGNAVTDNEGIAIVELPDYFEAINKDFRYQLTVIGSFAQIMVKEKISDNRFVIQSSEPGVEVSWQVTGVRDDAYARANPMRVVVDKIGRTQAIGGN